MTLFKKLKEQLDKELEHELRNATPSHIRERQEVQRRELEKKQQERRQTERLDRM